jgi:hypothetical protein
MKLFVMYADHIKMVPLNAALNKQVQVKMKKYESWTLDAQEICELSNIFFRQFTVEYISFELTLCKNFGFEKPNLVLK